MRPEFDHNLSHNKREWSPRRVIFFDTETNEERDEEGATLPLRSWELCAVWRDKKPGTKLRERWASGKTGLELAAKLDELVTTEYGVWCFAHNLGFDLTTTRLPVHLPRLGWKWTRGTITADSPWLGFAKGNKKLSLVDSFSHLPAALAKIGEEIGLPKLDMPPFSAPAAEWEAYGHRDVEILRDAVLQYMEWWDVTQIGNLSVSGAASGWNAFRHNTDNLRVKIDVDPEKRAWSRAAIYGGRRSGWRVGNLGKGPYVEIDIQTAHLSVCRHEQLPISIFGWMKPPAQDHPIWDSTKVGIVADCVVKTERHCYPKQTPAGVLYPNGEFRTRLAGPELKDARRRGELVSVHRALAVGLGRPMQQWGGWLDGLLRNPPPGTPPMARLAGKGWSRTVVGKWAGRTSREVHRFPIDDRGWRVETGFWMEPGVPCTTVFAADEARVYVRDQEAADSFPAVYAYITSYMRLLQQQLIDLVGEKNVVCCNTDSVVVHLDALLPHSGPGSLTVDAQIRTAVAKLETLLHPYQLSVKNVAETLRIRTPEHLIFGEGDEQKRKVSSVSMGAKETDPWRFEGDTWPGLAKQLSIGQGEQYRLERRRVNVANALPLGWVDEIGNVEPPRYECPLDGFEVLQYPEIRARLGQGWLKRAPQHRALRALLTA